MNLKIFIAEDCSFDSGNLQFLIIVWAKVNNFTIDFICKNNVANENDLFEAYTCDLIFLDIEMPIMSGFDFASKIRSKYGDIPIIFITSHTEYAILGYDIEASGFISKPVDNKKLCNVLNRVTQKILSENKMDNLQNKIILFSKNGLQKTIAVNDIYYIEAQLHNIIVSTAASTVKYPFVFKKLSEILPIPPFILVHRSYYVNIKYVKKFEKNLITVSDNKIIPVSDSRIKEVKEAIISYHIGDVQ